MSEEYRVPDPASAGMIRRGDEWKSADGIAQVIAVDADGIAYRFKGETETPIVSRAFFLREFRKVRSA